MSDWDQFALPTPSKTREQELEELVDRYEELREQADVVRDALEAAQDQILTHFPEDVGEYEQMFGKYRVAIKRGERWSWDSDALFGMFATRAVPDYVSQRFSIKRTDFESLPENEKVDLLPALTRKPGSAKITIKE